MGTIRSYRFESYAYIDAESEEEARTALEARLAFPALYGRTEWELTKVVDADELPGEAEDTSSMAPGALPCTTHDGKHRSYACPDWGGAP